MSIALIEAMRSGIPIIASKIPASEELLGEAGYILPLEEELWLEKINDLIESSESRRIYGKMAFERSKNFTVDKMGEKYEEIFR